MLPRKWIALIVLLHHFLCLVNHHDLGSRTRYPDHLLDRSHLVGKEIDSAYMEHTIECLDLKGESLGFTLKQMWSAERVFEITLALAQHSEGNINPVEINIIRQKS